MERMNFDVLRQSAADACRYARFSDKRIQNSMIEFYKEGKKSPSIARVVLKDQLHKSTKKYNKEALKSGTSVLEIIKKTRNAIKNIKFNYMYVSVLPYYNCFTGITHDLYPKTVRIREALIAHNRIKMDKVTKKAGLLKKLFIAKHIKF